MFANKFFRMIPISKNSIRNYVGELPYIHNTKVECESLSKELNQIKRKSGIFSRCAYLYNLNRISLTSLEFP